MRFIEIIHRAMLQCPQLCGGMASPDMTGKIFQSFAPPATAVPFIVIQNQSDDAVSPTLSSDDKMRVATVAVDCISTDLAVCGNIAEIVRYNLDKASGEVVGTYASPVVVQAVIAHGDSMIWDAGSDGTEIGVFVCTVNLKIFYRTVGSSPVALTAS